MPRTEEAYQQIRAARKEQILQAAASVFARKGLADTTVTDIAAEAGVSHGLLYRHFASKEDLFAAVVEQALTGGAHLARLALAQPGTAWERLRWITTQMIPGQSLDRRPAYSVVVLHALTNEGVPKHVQERAAEQGKIIFDPIRQLIVEGQAAGQVVAGEPDELAVMYLSCIQGLVLRAALAARMKSVFPSVETLLLILQAER